MFDFINNIAPITAKVDWTQTSTVVIAGILIVMVVLIFLIIIFRLFGLAVSKTENAAKKGKKSSKAEKASAPAPKAAPVPKAAPAPAAAPVVQSGISGEIVAAITAAITASEGNANFTVRSIKVKNVRSRNPWAAAAIAENVKPF